MWTSLPHHRPDSPNPSLIVGRRSSIFTDSTDGALPGVDPRPRLSFFFLHNSANDSILINSFDLVFLINLFLRIHVTV